MVSHILRINYYTDVLKQIIPAVEILRAGGAVAYPTETFYGLGVDALNQEAIRKIFSIKERPFSQPLLILIPNQNHLPYYAHEVPEVARRLIERYWPGPLTMIFAASPQLPLILTADTRKIAIRISSHPIAQAVTSLLKGPLTSTSANSSGAQSPTTAEEVLQQLGGKIDLIIDGGKTAGEKPSTIIDVTVSPPQLVREGALPFDEIWRHCKR